MIKKIDHLGIAINDLGDAQQVFDKILDKENYKQESVNSEGVNVAFYQIGENKLELLEALSEDSPVWQYINKKGEGIHHVALEVDDMAGEIERLKSLGFQFINETPKEGADNKEVCFLHPKSTKGVLVELCKEKT